MNSKVVISFLLILVSLVWAGSFIVVEIATTDISPVMLGFLRFVVATPVMVCILFLRGKDCVLPKKECPSLFVLGLTGVTLLYVFQFVGIAFTTASTGAVLINTNVIFIAVFSAFIFKERFQKKKITGIALSFFGVVVIVFSNGLSSTLVVGNTFFIGSILILFSALCWGIYSIVGKRLIQTYDIFSVTTYALVFGTVSYIPFVYSDIFNVFNQISLYGWVSIAYLAFGCTIFAYVGWFYALQKTVASKAAVYLNLIPLFTIVMSFFIGESFTLYFFAGAMLIIYGVYLTQKSN